jgi:predicted Zn-dependent protease
MAAGALRGGNDDLGHDSLPVSKFRKRYFRPEPMNPRIESLEKMLNGPRDGALLRFSLGNEYLKAGDPAKAAKCFQAAVDRDKHYSAAWKALGKALAEAGQPEAKRSPPMNTVLSSPRQRAIFRRPRK